jgi:hypothetical protein
VTICAQRAESRTRKGAGAARSGSARTRRPPRDGSSVPGCAAADDCRGDR